MTSRWSQRLTLAFGVLVALMGTGTQGCLQPREAVNRVQPDYLDKQQLIPVQYGALTRGRQPTELTESMVNQEPQWYHQVTIIDKPATTGFQGISWYTDMERITWEVTEDFLIARQAYEQLNNGQGQQGTGVTGTAPNGAISRNPQQREILAVYAIRSHFDIRRSYNAGTGEELNVIEENNSDRPWYQRRYMRVDWSRNLVGGYSVFSYTEWSGQVRAEPVPVFLNTPSDPNRPRFEYGQFNGTPNSLTYFDVTARVTLRPEEVNLAQWGYPNLPACLLVDQSTESCRPADVLMRQAFLRVDPNRDYEPQSLDGRRMARFGFFEVGRLGYNTNRNDILNTDRRHWSARHNLWMNHHARTPDNSIAHLPADAQFTCETDSDCRTLSGTAVCDTSSRTCGERFVRCVRDADCESVGIVGDAPHCDTAIGYNRGDNAGLCLLPYRQRTVRQVAYHLSENYPERMMPVTNATAQQWNRAFSTAVQSARHRECLRDPAVADKSECDAWYPDRNNPRREEITTARTGPEFMDPNRTTPVVDNPRFVWVACHNPVWGTAPGPGQHPEAEVQAANEAGWDLPQACGPQGTSARLGDIRYSMIGSVNELDRQGPWGLAMISGDPMTGEVISGRGAVWQTVTDLQAAYATDIIRILNGETTQDQFARGENVIEAYREALGGDLREARDTGRQPNSNDPNAPPLVPRSLFRPFSNETEMQNLLNATRFDQLGGLPAARAAGQNIMNGNNLSVNDLARYTDENGRTRYNEHSFLRNIARTVTQNAPLSGAGSSVANSRLSRLRGTDIEARMMNPDEYAGAGVDPRLAGTEHALEAASPARRNNLSMRQIGQRLRSMHSAHQCNYEAPFNDNVVATLVYRFRNNRVPGDVTFGQEWNFRAEGAGACTGQIPGCVPLNYDEVRRYLVQYIHYGVLLHELGHSIGERHNFAASADVVNYFDNYWSLRASRHGNNAMNILPRYQYLATGDGRNMADSRNYYSNLEQNEGIEEYGYASVMDYKGFNEDAHGLGRYDFAFVKHGYVNMVESFNNVANRADALHMFNGLAGNGAQGVEFGLIGTGSRPRLTSFHYTDIPRITGVVNRTTPNGMSGQLPNIGTENRFDVFLNETSSVSYNQFMWDPDHSNVSNYGPNGQAAGQPHVLVPYRFATDDQAGYYWYDQRYDAGADMFESLNYRATRYFDYYFANSFARERSSFTTSGYRGRMAGRYFDDLYYVSRVSTIINYFYAAVFDQATGYNEWLNMRSGTSQRLAVALTFNLLANTVMMPQWSIYGGGHTLRRRTDGPQGFTSEVYEESQFGDPVNLQLRIGEGRMYETRYDYDSGMFWSERLINAGSYHDKILALQYMTETFLFAPDSRDFGDELRRYQVNMYTLYPAQTIRLFGSLLSQDHGDVGAQVRDPMRNTQEVIRTQIPLLNLPTGTGMGQNGRDPNLRAIDPQMGFTTELWTAVFSMANFSAGFDQRFVTSARLWAAGDANAITPPMGAQVVSFTDPINNITFNALHFGRTPGDPSLDPGASARELHRTMGNADDAERGIAARMLLRAQDLRRVWEETTEPAAKAAAQRRMSQYVDLLNVMRALNRYFAQGSTI